MGAKSLRVTDVVWVLLLVAAGVACVFVVRDAAKTPVSYSTGYDGTDPGSCAYGVKQVSIVADGQTPLIGEGGRRIGTVLMRRSLKCDTVWAQVFLDRESSKQLKGRIVEIVMRRPADNRVAPYPLTLKGGAVGRVSFPG
jgi:hypothetical protein